ncbi:MAG TPA: TetR family transcriptional regulator [Terriglobales bacterium]|nr:TetR family transcriptional regulator [Terriglobales bacterium]
MKRSKQETAETRERIVEAAAAEFRKNGIDRTGLNDLMAAAGLTHGGFYRHFRTKNELVAEASEAAFRTLATRLAELVAAKSRQDGAEVVTAEYLSAEHRDHPEVGCFLAANASELARADVSIRDVATEGFLRLVELIAAQYDGRKDAAKRRAIVAVSTMIGAIALSRIVTDPDLSNEILAQAEKQLSAA